MRDQLRSGARVTESGMLVRSRLLDMLLRGAALLSVLFLLLYLMNPLTQGGWIRLISGMILAAALWLSALQPEWSYSLRAWVLLAAIYLFSISNLLTVGLAGEARLTLLLLPIVALVLIGLRAGVTVATTVMVTMVLATLMQDRGVIPLTPIELVAYATASNWVGYVMFFLIMVLVALVALGRVLFGMESALRDQRELAVRLQRERQQMESRIAERQQALRTSIAVSGDLAHIGDAQELAQIVANQVQESMGYGRVLVYLRNEEIRQLVLAAVKSAENMAYVRVQARYLWGEGFIGQGASENRVVTDPQAAAAQWRSMEDRAVKLIAAPISLGDRVLGMLVAEEEELELGREDAALLTAVAAQMAGILQNLSAFEWARQQAEVQAQANTIMRRIQTTTTIDEALQVATEALSEMLQAERTHIVITNPDEMPAQNGQAHRQPVTANKDR